MSNIIDKIQVSGVTYDIQGSGGGGVPESAFTAYTATTNERISQDEEVTAAALNVLNESLSGKQDTLSAGTNITISGNVISAEGGGKAIEAGRGISITTGETADTVSFNLPISAGTGTNSIVEGHTSNKASGNYSHAEGRGTSASGYVSHAEGYYTTASGLYSHAEGNGTVANGSHSHAEGYNTSASNYSHSEGYNTNASGINSHAEGQYNETTNQSEHASGQYNVSSSGSSTWGDSGNTLFSVGNGDWSARHNAFEIRQNGDIYLSSGGTDIKLQDHLGGGGGGISSAECQTMIDENISGKTDNTTFTAYTSSTDTVIQGKQDTLVSGTNIKTINNTSILGSGNIDIQGSGNPTVELTQAEYDALVSAGTVSADTYYIITDAQTPDISQYWTSAQTQSAINQATSGKVNTSSVVRSVTSASTNNEIPTAKAVFDAIPTGGTSYSAGRGIDITNNEISVSIPISGASTGSIIQGSGTQANGAYAHAEGQNTRAINAYAHAEGQNTTANTAAHSEGGFTKANGQYSHAEGYYTTANTQGSHAEGYYTQTSNNYEHASGVYNVTSNGSTTADKTLFSVGNGTADNARHNAFEIRQNGDIYLNDGTNDVKLQDYLHIKVVKLTQSAYDVLSPNYDSNTLYIIKD